MASLTRREFRATPLNFKALSFVADLPSGPRKTRRTFWAVPPASSYAQACAAGHQYACELVQFLKENPALIGAGTIGSMVQDMAATPRGTPGHGHQVGFWTAIETILSHAAHTQDHWATVQAMQDRFSAAVAARELQGAAHV